MSESNSPNGAPDNADGEILDHTDESSNADGKGKNQVAYDTYQKAMSALAKAKKEAREVNARLSKLEQDKLDADGNKDKVIESLKSKSTSYERQIQQYAKKQLSTQVAREAEKLGSVDSDAVVKLLDLSQFELDTDSFETDASQIKSALEDLKKQKPYLFNKAAPKINTDLPGKIQEAKRKDLSTMSKDDIKAELNKLRNGQ